MTKVYPIPAQDELTINFETTSTDAIITIFNALGSKVLIQEISNASKSNQINLDISELSIGQYFLIFNTNEAQEKVKFMKIRD